MIDLTSTPRTQTIARLRELSDCVEFLRIDSGEGYVDGVFKRETSSDKLIILFPAALTNAALAERKFPYIPRWGWVESIPANVWCFEEVIARRYNILAGWFQEKNYFFADVVAEMIDGIAKSIGISWENIIMSGSSLGGFGALMVAPLLPGSKVVADISQTDLSSYRFKSHIETMCEKVYGSRDIKSISNSYPDRFSVSKRFEKIGHVPDMIILHELTDEPNGSQQIYPFFSDLFSLKDTNPKGFQFKGIIRNDGNGHIAMRKIEFMTLVSNEYGI